GSSGVPGSSAGRVVGTCFTLHRTGFGEPPCRHDAGGLLPHPFTLTAGVSGESFAGGGFLSVPLSVGFRRLGFPQRPALRCPDFPRLRTPANRVNPAITRPASRIVARILPRPPRARASSRTRDTRRRPRGAVRTRRRRGTRGSRRGAARRAPARGS